MKEDGVTYDAESLRVAPAPRREEFPTLLEDFPVPVVKMYRPETVVAEKLHGMAKLGLANSRMKDYYDVWHLSQRYEFDSASLARAIRRTFERLPRVGAGTEAWWQAAENAPSAPV